VHLRTARQMRHAKGGTRKSRLGQIIMPHLSFDITSFYGHMSRLCRV
jgi:hypothetical protein